MADTDPKVRLTGNEKIILIALILGIFMTSLDATIVSVALPTMAEEFGEDGHNTSNISWVLLIYTMMLSSFILLWSKIGTNTGYKRIFVTGIAVFTVSSLAIGLCGLRPELGLYVVIILRAVQGLGAGMAMAMSLAMTTTYLPAAARGSCIGAVTLAASCGTAMGPALGGLLTTLHWSYIFFINVPIGVVCVFLCIRYMKVKEHKPDNAPKTDFLGVAFMLAMMFSLIYYLNKGQDFGWMSDVGILLLAVTFVSAGLLSWWEQRVSDPLVSMRLITNSNILKANLVTMLMFMAMAGSYLLLPYYFGYLKGLSTVEYGFILIANSVGMMVSGPLVGRITDRTGDNRMFIIIGTLLATLGFVMMMSFGPDTGIPYILLALFVMGAGMGMALVCATNLAYGYITEEENGQLSGQTMTFRQAGSSAGVAVLNAVFVANLAIGAGSTAAVLMPGFRHAFFIAVVLSMIAFAVAMSSRNAKDVRKE